MNDATIAALIHRFRSAAQCAAALGISRQAFRAAMQRGQLSNAVALRAAAPDLPKQPYITTCRNNNYALYESIKKTADTVRINPNVHVITSQNRPGHHRANVASRAILLGLPRD